MLFPREFGEGGAGKLHGGTARGQFCKEGRGGQTDQAQTPGVQPNKEQEHCFPFAE